MKVSNNKGLSLTKIITTIIILPEAHHHVHLSSFSSQSHHHQIITTNHYPPPPPPLLPSLLPTPANTNTTLGFPAKNLTFRERFGATFRWFPPKLSLPLSLSRLFNHSPSVRRPFIGRNARIVLHRGRNSYQVLYIG